MASKNSSLIENLSCIQGKQNSMHYVQICLPYNPNQSVSQSSRQLYNFFLPYLTNSKSPQEPSRISENSKDKLYFFPSRKITFETSDQLLDFHELYSSDKSSSSEQKNYKCMDKSFDVVIRDVGLKVEEMHCQNKEMKVLIKKLKELLKERERVPQIQQILQMKQQIQKLKAVNDQLANAYILQTQKLFKIIEQNREKLTQIQQTLLQQCKIDPKMAEIAAKVRLIIGEKDNLVKLPSSIMYQIELSQYIILNQSSQEEEQLLLKAIAASRPLQNISQSSILEQSQVKPVATALKQR